MGFVLHGRTERGAGFFTSHQDTDSAWVCPVFRVQFVRFEGDVEAGGGDGRGDKLACFGDIPGERIAGAEFGAYAPALSAGATGVEVERVEG